MRERNRQCSLDDHSCLVLLYSAYSWAWAALSGFRCDRVKLKKVARFCSIHPNHRRRPSARTRPFP
ncbi:MAG: hypothetical protein C0184_04795, partial [Chloroflexus aggregans]